MITPSCGTFSSFKHLPSTSSAIPAPYLPAVSNTGIPGAFATVSFTICSFVSNGTASYKLPNPVVPKITGGSFIDGIILSALWMVVLCAYINLQVDKNGWHYCQKNLLVLLQLKKQNMFLQYSAYPCS